MEKVDAVPKTKPDGEEVACEVTAAKEDYRDVMKHCRLGDGIQIANQMTKDLGILCSINNTESEDRFVLGSYNHVAFWDRKTKEVQVVKVEVGGTVNLNQEFGHMEILMDLKL